LFIINDVTINKSQNVDNKNGFGDNFGRFNSLATPKSSFTAGNLGDD